VPLVAKRSTCQPLWVIGAGAVVAGLLLFGALEARRQAAVAPAVRLRSLDAVAAAAPPPLLYIPPEPAPAPAPQPMLMAMPPQPAAAPPAPMLSAEPVRAQPQPLLPAQPSQNTPPPPPARTASGPALMIDNSTTASGNGSGATPGAATASGGGDAASGGKIAGARVGAGVLASRTLTVPQGTLIPAILETALDSTLPGLARAVVSSDIRGFDGTRILIPRGSRLIGEYAANVDSGQNRMLVNWLRLIRPDGATIAIGSPAADPVGTGGVRARVNSHFFERFSGAILQSALDVGVNLASRSANSSLVVALPGSTSAFRQSVTPNQVRPTLKVKPATSISVFVARDLDFTGIENQ
jgi:type IV secretion system protein VirB10